MNETVDKYKDLFRLMDASFSSLCTINSSEADCNIAKEGATATMNQWWLMLLSVTPKVHSFEDHTVDQMIFFGGVADKSEDFAEWSHQDGKQEHQRTGWICNFSKWHNCAQRNKFITADPRIQQQIFYVHQNKRQRLSHEVSLKHEQTAAKKVIREEIRKWGDEICCHWWGINVKS